MNIEKLAQNITDDLFESGDEPGSPTTRIQFMGGEWPDNEVAQGGFNKDACAAFMRHMIEKHIPIQP